MKEIRLSELYNLPEKQMGVLTLLGIEKALVSDDSFAVVMEVGEAHINTHGTVHGGILYTLCAQAVGGYAACRNREGVGMDGSIHYYRPAKKGDVLTATAYERKSGKTVGVHFVELKNQDGRLLADGLFTTMYLD